MATITPTYACMDGDSGTIKVTWANMLNGDIGLPVKLTEQKDRSVQVVGTFSAGGSLRWEGTNDETNYVALTDPQGNDLNFTTAKIEAVTEIVLLARPRVTAGDGNTTLTVTALLTRPRWE